MEERWEVDETFLNDISLTCNVGSYNVAQHMHELFLPIFYERVNEV